MNSEVSICWVEWTKLNLQRGCAREDLRKLLLEGGHSAAQAAHLLSAAETESETYAFEETTQAGEPTAQGSEPVFLPLANRIPTEKAEMYQLENFLSEDECIKLINIIASDMKPSTVTQGCPSVRTSSTCEFWNADDPIVDLIDKRIARYIGIDNSSAERLQGQWYEPGEEFKAHTDYFDGERESVAKHVGDQGQRSWTFMIYLNSTRSGGITHFPNLDLSFTPKAGTALIWNNYNSSGQLNDQTLHHGTPVKEGFKAIITKWFRTQSPTITYKKEPSELLRPLTRSGFHKTKIPENLYWKLLGFYNAKRSTAINEHLPEFINNEQSEFTNPASVLMHLPEHFKEEIHQALLPTVEAWIGDKLDPTVIFGVREYRQGCVLKVHRDRLKTHLASVIMNVDQRVTTDWPLYIEDHFYRGHEIMLKPGEMLLYEGARLAHGRPTPFEGESYANVFVHYKQKNLS